jgi:anthranilate 1,2-dioxygenase small subunit
MLTLETRVVVEDLMHAYVHCIDEDRLEEWPSFFAAECVYKIIPRENLDQDLPIPLMSCDSQGMLGDRVTAHRQANIFGPHFYRHMVSSILLTQQDDGLIAARSNYVVFRTWADVVQYGSTEVFSAGAYRDQIVFEDGRAKFRQRLVIVDTCRVDSLLVTPL